MTYPLSRAMSIATAGYAAYALAKPRHLADAMEIKGSQAEAMDRVAYTYGVRDLGISALALSKRPSVVTASMLLRIVGDLGDGAILGAKADRPEIRNKVLGVTIGWAALNTLALLIDRRRR